MNRAIEYTKASFQIRFRYKANSILQIAGTIIVVLIQYYLWSSINMDSNVGVENIILYTILARIILSLYPDYTTIRFVADKILKGEIALYLIRPLKLYIIVFFNELGNLLYNLIFIFIPSIIITLILVDLPLSVISLENTLLFIVSFMLSYFLSFLLSYFIACLSIWIINIWGILEFYDALLLICGGTLIPLSIYPEIVQKILALLPFQSIFFTPLAIFTGNNSLVNNPLLVQVLWIILLIGINLVVTNVIKKRINFMGG
ncbi:ABC-2 family transporter protein [Virgibacillus pantothenticus]|uniref:ABC transporter permease n=1 Tax=Virgibacillus pantothenticus TaxID=1473 RepID=UPI003D29A465